MSLIDRGISDFWLRPSFPLGILIPLGHPAEANSCCLTKSEIRIEFHASGFVAIKESNKRSYSNSWIQETETLSSLSRLENNPNKNKEAVSKVLFVTLKEVEMWFRMIAMAIEAIQDGLRSIYATSCTQYAKSLTKAISLMSQSGIFDEKDGAKCLQINKSAELPFSGVEYRF